MREYLGFVIAAIILAVAFFAFKITQEKPVSPAHLSDATASLVAASAAYRQQGLTVESFTCTARNDRIGARITVRNGGPQTLPFVKVFFDLGDQHVDTYTSPASIPAGSYASANWSVDGQGDCRLIAIQSSGRRVAYSHSPGEQP